jgi:hypothetical protein
MQRPAHSEGSEETQLGNDLLLAKFDRCHVTEGSLGLLSCVAENDNLDDASALLAATWPLFWQRGRLLLQISAVAELESWSYSFSCCFHVFGNAWLIGHRVLSHPL